MVRGNACQSAISSLDFKAFRFKRLRRKATLAAGVASVLGVTGGSHLLAATTNYFWDPTISNGASLGGTGTWNTTLGNWYNGSSADTVWASTSTANTSAAVFSGTPGTVTLGSPMVAAALNFSSGGYTVAANGTNTLTLTSTTTTGLTTTGGAEIITPGAGVVETLSGPVIIDDGLGNGAAWTVASTDTVNFTGTLAQGSVYGTPTGGNNLVISGLGTFNYSGSSFAPSKFTVTGGGTFNSNGVVSLPNPNGTYTGIGDTGTGTLNINGSTFTTIATLFLGTGTGGTGMVNVNGGTLTTTTTVNIGDGYNNNGSAIGVLSISGGTMTTGTGTGNIRVGNATNGSGTINLNSGVLATNCNIAPGTGGAVSGLTKANIFNFNGGTLQANGTSLAMSGLQANVRSGGAIINTNGFNVSIGQALIHSALAADTGLTTDGGLTKNGTGLLTLNGTNTYLGTTTVNAGILRAGNAAAFPSTLVTGAGALAVGAAGTLDLNGQYQVSGGSSGLGFSAASLNVASGGLLNFDLNSTSSQSDQITVVGSANNASGGRISVTLLGTTALTPGSYTLISGSAGLSGFTLNTSKVTASGLTYPLTLNSTATSDVLNIGTGQQTALYYTGAIDSNFNTLSGGQSNFATTAAGTTNAASIPGSLSDVFLTANSANNLAANLGQNFTINSLNFTGTGTAGTNPVSVGGSNTLTILAAAAANAAGTGIVVATGAGADVISANVALGGNLAIANNNPSVPFTITGNVNASTYTLTSSSANGSTGLTAISGVISGSGGLNVPSGTLIVSGANTYTGPTNIVGGILNVSTFGTTGSASPLGITSNAASNLVLAGGGTLQYNGSTGMTTDRLFTIGATGYSSAGVIDSSGAAPITFSNAGAVAFAVTGTHTLTLQGSNTGANTFLPLISDQSAGNATSLVKGGDGTWIISSSNSFTGGTSINGGSGDLEITNGNALGTGTISISGNNLFTGTLQLANGITLANTINITQSRDDLEVGAPPQIESLSGNNTITSSGFGMAAGGTGDNFVVDSGLLTFTGNFIGETSGSTFARPYELSGAGNGVISGMIAAGNGGGTAVYMYGSGTWTLNNSTSTFAAGVQVDNGVLSVNSLSNGGSPSALGASNNSAGAILLQGGTLQYTGPAVSTDRLFTVVPPARRSIHRVPAQSPSLTPGQTPPATPPRQFIISVTPAPRSSTPLIILTSTWRLVKPFQARESPAAQRLPLSI